MQAIKAYTQIYDDIENDDILKKIELCGRVCYKSEGKIKEGSAEKFVTNIIKRGHEAVLEHGSYIFEVPHEVYETIQRDVDILEEMEDFKSFLRFTYDGRPIISGNVRAWRDFFRWCVVIFDGIHDSFEEFIKDNILFPEFQNVNFIDTPYDKVTLLRPTQLRTEQEILKHWDVTVKFVVDRGVSHEAVRHRPASYCQESTRWCNYSKDDFGSQITSIIPDFLIYGTEAWDVWKDVMKYCENAYFKLLNIGLTPEEARVVLPNSLKTELVMTANCSEWKKFFHLRCANAAHPQMREVTRPLLFDMKEYIHNIFDDIVF